MTKIWLPVNLPLLPPPPVILLLLLPLPEVAVAIVVDIVDTVDIADTVEATVDS